MIGEKAADLIETAANLPASLFRSKQRFRGVGVRRDFRMPMPLLPHSVMLTFTVGSVLLQVRRRRPPDRHARVYGTPYARTAP